MRKTICLAVVVVMVMAVAGVASAGNKVGVGYAFEGSDKALSLVGELALSDRIAFGFDYLGWDTTVTELFAKLTLQDLGATAFGAFGGVKLLEGGTSNTFKIGVFAEQSMSPQVSVYGRVGMAFEATVSNSWVEALGGVKADIMSPFWLAGEVLYDGETSFRALVGMSF